MKINLAKVTEVAGTIGTSAGAIGMVAWAGWSLWALGTVVKEEIQRRWRERYQKGYDDAKELYSSEIEALKEHNKILTKEAYSASEGS